MSDVTLLLNQMESGDQQAASQLLPLIYEELRRLAAHKLAAERKDLTLQATALVHEAYLRLVGSDDVRRWTGRSHFFATAAEAMRRVLIEEARKRKAVKRGGDRQRDYAEVDHLPANARPDRLLELDQALQRLEEISPQRANLIKMRYFVGMTLREAAEALGISEKTAERQWNFARSWLQCELKETA